MYTWMENDNCDIWNRGDVNLPYKRKVRRTCYAGAADFF